MKPELIFVTGYFGAPIRETAKRIADEKGYELISLDDEIERADGRPVLRICMMMGEHEYRNKEYELLSSIVADVENTGAKNAVLLCGDGVLHDEMSRDIINKHHLIIAGSDMTRDELWENARSIKNSYHAFMHFGSDESRRKAFDELYERQRKLYDSLEV